MLNPKCFLVMLKKTPHQPFKNTVIGSNLKKSLIDLLDNIKDTKSISEFMKQAILTTIPKKGLKLFLENERGIFIVNTVLLETF